MTKLLAVGLALVLTTLAPLRDPNKKAQLVKGWGEVVDPDGDCRVVEDKGVVAITLPGTHHDLTHQKDYVVLNAPRVLQPIDGDCELRVKVLTFPLPGEATAAGGGQSFVSTGLLLWQDDKNFVRFERAAMGGFEQPFVWLERFKDGKTAVEKFKLIADKETGLQIKREGSRFTFSYDEVGDKKAWTVFHAEEFDLPFKLRAGVVAVNSTIREFPARLTGFEIGGKK